jgi:acylphosphatase
VSDAQDLRRVHLWISGRVQGVFYRAATSEKAQSRGLTGWVRNAPDGRVEAEVQGSPDAVDELIDECRSGPPMAKVEEIEVSDIDPEPDERRFQVV